MADIPSQKGNYRMLIFPRRAGHIKQPVEPRRQLARPKVSCWGLEGNTIKRYRVGQRQVAVVCMDTDTIVNKY